MSLITRINLWKLKRAMGPSKAFKASLHKNLNTIWDAKHGNGMSLHHVVVARVAGSFAVITMLLTGGGWVYAYTSPEVTEGSALYPVKEVIETIQEVTKITPEAKARFYIKKIERREAEREVLEKKIHLPEVPEIKETEKKEEVKTDKKENVEKVIGKDVKEEKREVVEKEKVRAKIKIEVEERKIKRTEKSIERIEEELEKTRQIIEKTESKNIKLREELRIRAEKRLEKIKSNQEKLLQLRQRSGEVRNTSSIKR